MHAGRPISFFNFLSLGLLLFCGEAGTRDRFGYKPFVAKIFRNMQSAKNAEDVANSLN